jgi:ornithine cyclodeaminase
MKVFDAAATARALAWPSLVASVEATIRESNVGLATCPPRVGVPLGDDAVWLLMPAWSRGTDIAACKLITVHAGNAARGLPTIQGDILVIRASTGERLALLDGPTVTARRTAAVTALAIRLIREARDRSATRSGASANHDTAGNSGNSGNPGNSDNPGSCLIIGSGVQGRSHLEAIGAMFPGTRFFLHSRSVESAKRLAAHATANGIAARVVADPHAVLPSVDIVACCTPAMEIVLRESPREGAIIAAIGSFKPQMSELAPAVMQRIGRNILLDSADAGHEAGELVQAGVDPQGLPTLLTWHDNALPAVARTVLFKSCGSALWDLAAAQAAVGAAAPSEAS